MTNDEFQELHDKAQRIVEGLMKASPADAFKGTIEITELGHKMSGGGEEMDNETYQKNVNTLLNLALIGHITMKNLVGESTGIKDAADEVRARRGLDKDNKPKGDGGLTFL